MTCFGIKMRFSAFLAFFKISFFQLAHEQIVFFGIAGKWLNGN